MRKNQNISAKFKQTLIRQVSGGRCVAQRIKIPMIAGGNHTLIQKDPPLRNGVLQTFKLQFDEQ